MVVLCVFKLCTHWYTLTGLYPTTVCVCTYVRMSVHMQSGGSFKPFKLPSSALFFKPPRTKTENMQKKDFLGHAVVVSSVQDNDDFTGFIGAQGQVRRKACFDTDTGYFVMYDLVQVIM